MPSSSSRDPMADALRGFAAVLVIAGHFITRDIAKLPAPYWFYEIRCIIHMPPFFFFSGLFFEAASHRPFSVFLRQKAIRLLLPYVTWSSVAVAAKAAMSLLQGTFVFKQELLLWANTLLFSESMWFFISLFTVQVVGWFLWQALNKWHAWALLFPLLLVVLPGSSVFAWHKTQEMLPFFVLGLLMARYRLSYRVDRLPPPEPQFYVFRRSLCWQQHHGMSPY